MVLGWKNGEDLEIMTQNKSLINLLVFSDPPNKGWVLTVVYGPPYKARRVKL